MAKNKRTIWDDLVELGRRILEELDDLLLPKQQEPPKPARVPVPVRNTPRKPQNNPYEQD